MHVNVVYNIMQALLFNLHRLLVRAGASNQATATLVFLNGQNNVMLGIGDILSILTV